jgi:hypothetical protein
MKEARRTCKEKNRESKIVNYWKEAADQPFIKKKGLRSPSNTMTKACSEIVQY